MYMTVYPSLNIFYIPDSEASIKDIKAWHFYCFPYFFYKKLFSKTIFYHDAQNPNC